MRREISPHRTHYYPYPKSFLEVFVFSSDERPNQGYLHHSGIQNEQKGYAKNWNAHNEKMKKTVASVDINSGGGTPVQASIIHDAIIDLKKKYHKKVIVVGEDMICIVRILLGNT